MQYRSEHHAKRKRVEDKALFKLGNTSQHTGEAQEERREEHEPCEENKLLQCNRIKTRRNKSGERRHNGEQDERYPRAGRGKYGPRAGKKVHLLLAATAPTIASGYRHEHGYRNKGGNRHVEKVRDAKGGVVNIKLA